MSKKVVLLAWIDMVEVYDPEADEYHEVQLSTPITVVRHEITAAVQVEAFAQELADKAAPHWKVELDEVRHNVMPAVYDLLKEEPHV